jgi:CubicO group peptidase (beta-lactamase class C family)
MEPRVLLVGGRLATGRFAASEDPNADAYTGETNVNRVTSIASPVARIGPQYHLGVHLEESLHGSVMVTKAGSILADLAGGLADVENGIACTTLTRFQVASVSKQFAATAVMLVVESGDLDLNDPVDRWLPRASSQWRKVTMHHILSHTAGIPHWREAPGLDPAEPMSIGERLACIQAAPLHTEPGTQWHYSSPAYLLAGFIVERVTGQPYRDFLATQILSPLRLTQTAVGTVPLGAALGYKAAQPVKPFDLNTMPGTGDIWSTSSDLTKFVAALHQGELVSPSSLRTMSTAHTGIEDHDEGDPRLTTTGYGYGMYTGIFGRHAALYHSGDNPGYKSMACWLPDQAASIVILLNDEATDITSLLRQLLALTRGS